MLLASREGRDRDWEMGETDWGFTGSPAVVDVRGWRGRGGLAAPGH